MRLIYKHKHEGLFFSHRGHKAYLRGEKPKELWPADAKLKETEVHHIGRSTGSWYGGYTRELIMFYKMDNVFPMYPAERLSDEHLPNGVGVPYRRDEA